MVDGILKVKPTYRSGVLGTEGAGTGVQVLVHRTGQRFRGEGRVAIVSLK